MSNNSIKVTLTVAPENELFARRGLQKGGRVQKYIDSEVLRCCDSYVPMLTLVSLSLIMASLPIGLSRAC